MTARRVGTLALPLSMDGDRIINARGECVAYESESGRGQALVSALADCERLRAALAVFVGRCARVSASSDPRYCVHESDVTDAELQEARAALRNGGAL